MNQPGPTLALHLRLDGFEGPLDLLLDLARAQKVDLARISLVALVDQYLAVVEEARALVDQGVVELTLLLPPDEAGKEPDAEALAAALTDRLAELERMRAAAAWLGRCDQLGRDVFGRGAAESLIVQDRTGIAAELPALLQAYAAARRRALGRRPYTPKPRRLWTVQEAIARLGRVIGRLPDWAVLQRFLPESLAELDTVERRAALASTLLAALETARGGAVELRQDRAFGPIMVRRRAAEEEVAHVRAA